MAKKLAVSNAPQRTIGPVSDLERHLPTEWWSTLFDSLYLKTDGDVVENDDNTARDVDLLLKAVALRPDDRVLDVCCGQGRHCIELARRGFAHVAGVDRSRYLIRLARKRARQLGLPVTFQEGDARKLRRPKQLYNCVTLFGNSFGYFEHQDDDYAVLDAVKHMLTSGGRLFMDVVDGAWMQANFEPRSWEWIDQEHLVCRERSLAQDRQRLVCREVVVHAERGVIADRFYAERLYTFQDLKSLLEDSGFQRVEQFAAPATGSDRAQDLGMMARRLVVTARLAQAVGEVRRRAPLFPAVTVLMGDPGLPDEVKRDGQFNPEDMDTINRLKEALSGLSGYTFTYFNEHGGLVDALKTQPPAFVLNLCDEGYENDAFKELHVPALLEMFGVPYSGAGPACLGLCYNKAFVRSIAMSLDVPVPLETFISAEDQSASLPSVFPALLKPNCGDSSVGITKDAVVHNSEELIAYINTVREEMPGRALLVQEFLPGNEYSVGLVGNPGNGFHVLPLLEVDYSHLDPALPRILGYESKWLPESPYWTQIKYRKAQLDGETRRRLIDNSTQLFERLGCRDYARFDWRADAQGEIKLLEVNPNPGWCWDGKLNIMAEWDGLTYADLLKLILDAAQERYAPTAESGSVWQTPASTLALRNA